MELDDILSVIPAEGRLYDPSEVILIGAHLEPSPRTMESADDNESTRELTHKDGEKVSVLQARRMGYLKVKSDLADKLTLECHPVQATVGSGTGRETNPAIAVVYAYAYEGHTYRLDAPRIMVVNGPGEAYDGSGDDTEKTGKLYLWRMSKHAHTISIEVANGSLQTLILDSNQPGNRSVTSYASHMQLAHRGGRLS